MAESTRHSRTLPRHPHARSRALCSAPLRPTAPYPTTNPSGSPLSRWATRQNRRGRAGGEALGAVAGSEGKEEEKERKEEESRQERGREEMRLGRRGKGVVRGVLRRRRPVAGPRRPGCTLLTNTRSPCARQRTTAPYSQLHTEYCSQ
eukprot:3931850-Rhodomonas_salina.2